ncbi:hypothetical protein Desor_0683 [Desulfosporosinus orientis DSM 765]|uniref:Uncharacterized protein n=1 Tax=Desulfosporosinus orientis (strain ATCC 19365 / DSM 765 / NCIMB 8382 / VKM B-1628 / Singapore I) TaxID=768706 RepID=G7W5E5_DESOD|nr:hypothetical protein [Desulfosporosinus orientis]AET66373.1 hypothetical protein Desor_0683 [Desulfosporosinus orientis DSM 765]
MERNEFIKMIKERIMDTCEVIDYLGVSKQRLSDMKTRGKVHEIKKGLFLREDIEIIKINQKDLREKFNKDTAYELFPVYKLIDDIVIIDKLRFFDCVTMVKHSCTNDIYNDQLEQTLKLILERLKAGSRVFMLDHKSFDYIENEEDMKQNGVILKEFTERTFREFLEYDGASIIGLNKIGNYNEILKQLESE